MRNFGKQFARDHQNGLLAIHPGFQDGGAELLLVSLYEVVIEGDRAFFGRSGRPRRSRRSRRFGGSGRRVQPEASRREQQARQEEQAV